MSDIGINQVVAQMRVMAAAARADETPAASAESGMKFSALMADSLEAVNGSMMEAKAKGQAFERGDPNVSIADVMVTSQRAGLEFRAVTEVRNKLLTAYQEVMRMQV